MTTTLKKAMLTTFAASALFLSACSNNAEPEATESAADAPVQQPENDVSTSDMAEAQANDTAVATDNTAVATADGMHNPDDMNNMDNMDMNSTDDVAVASADDTAVLDGTESEEHVSTY